MRRPVETGETAAETARRQAGAERQHLAGALHDQIGPLLFAIAAGTQRARALHGDDVVELHRTLERISEQVLEASDRMRDILAGSAPADPGEAVPSAIDRDLTDLRTRSSLGTQLIVRGSARRLTAQQERAVLACARQGLHNVEKHSGATQVVVTLTYSPGSVTLVVLDDGRGIDPGTVLAAVPEGRNRWGFVSMVREAEQNGGEISLRDVDGGAALRLRLPT
ncbi:sensor histidine kinase [Pseudonocardia sp. EC080610-09]|uniref:sensor histidine kinase n=1 Tax=Pseudonocardia sp. EC080610-09 TaxID=1688404 RepID=UPI001438C6A5|nr:histidine kinase [Pseudonocardia sp. EC080610-09]